MLIQKMSNTIKHVIETVLILQLPALKLAYYTLTMFVYDDSLDFVLKNMKEFLKKNVTGKTIEIISMNAYFPVLTVVVLPIYTESNHHLPKPYY